MAGRSLVVKGNAETKAEMPTEPKAEPFVKWAGGKRQTLEKLKLHIPPLYGRYFEPFVGGGALFFDLSPRTAFLGDQNGRLVTTYLAIRDHVEKVIALLKTYPYEKEFFLETRAKDIDDEKKYGPVEVAAWFIYLNRAGFNGMYRVNQSGAFNVPFGKYTNPTICNEGALRAASKALRRAKIVGADFEVTTRSARAGDFVYFDPPYIPSSGTSDFTTYTPEGFKPADHERLRDYALELSRRGVHVLLSNSDTPAARELYAKKPFTIHEIQSRRSVNSKTEKRGAVSELIIVAKTRSVRS